MKMKFNKRQRVSGPTEVAPRSSLKSSRAWNDLAAGNFIMRMDGWRFAAPAATVLSPGRTWPTTSIGFSWWFAGRKWHSVKMPKHSSPRPGPNGRNRWRFLAVLCRNLGVYCFYLLRSCCCYVGTFILWMENTAVTAEKKERLQRFCR